MERRAVSKRLGSCAGVAVLVSCASQRPVSPETQLSGQLATELVLELPEPCTIVPGGAPVGRSGVHGYTLPAGSYRPILEDDEGVYFASPTDILMIEPTLRAVNPSPGGIYVPFNRELSAFQFLGDADGVDSRERLPTRCRFLLSGSEEKASRGS